MEQIQEEKIFVFTFRMIGVVMILAGLILITQEIIISMIPQPKVIQQGVAIAGTEMERYVKLLPVLWHIAIIVWGWVIFFFAKTLGKMITS
jgi:hypothetical protein